MTIRQFIIGTVSTLVEGACCAGCILIAVIAAFSNFNQLEQSFWPYAWIFAGWVILFLLGSIATPLIVGTVSRTPVFRMGRLAIPLFLGLRVWPDVFVYTSLGTIKGVDNVILAFFVIPIVIVAVTTFVNINLFYRMLPRAHTTHQQL